MDWLEKLRDNMNDKLKNLYWMIPFIRDYKGLMTIRIVTSVMTVLNSMSAALIIQLVADMALLKQGSYQHVLILFLVTFVSTAVTNYLLNASSGKLHAEIRYSMQQQMMNHLQNISVAEKEKWN